MAIFLVVPMPYFSRDGSTNCVRVTYDDSRTVIDAEARSFGGGAGVLVTAGGPLLGGKTERPSDCRLAFFTSEQVAPSELPSLRFSAERDVDRAGELARRYGETGPLERLAVGIAPDDRVAWVWNTIASRSGAHAAARIANSIAEDLPPGRQAEARAVLSNWNPARCPLSSSAPS